MAQVFHTLDSWRGGEVPKPLADSPPSPKLYVHDDELSRYIDEILDGNQPPVSAAHARANAWPGDWRGWIIFWAMLTVAIWVIAKISLL